MFNLCKNFIKFNEELYLVKKIYLVEKVLDVEGIKAWLDCDTVLKREESYYFCQLIPNLEIIENEQITTS